MLDVITKFIDWIKNAFSFITGLPGLLSSTISSFSGILSFLPNGLGTVIIGFILFSLTFVMIYAIVKLVTNLL